jgi:hypothetical protein
VDIYESKPYPVLRHEFYGLTQDEAEGYFKAHMGTDEFLRKCVERGDFRGLSCHAEMKWRRVRLRAATSPRG